jgi:aquaporin Z
MTRRLGAELFGTFALVFAGTGAVVVNAASGGQVTHVGVSLTFGLIVLAMVYSVGDVSGAHLNPAVTVGFCVAGQSPVRHVLPYVAARCAGAFLASGTLRLLFPDSATLGATLPAGTAIQSFIFEVILTLMLMFVALSVATGAKERGLMAGVAVGGVVALEALFAGPVCGASMNPARSLAPAVVSGHLEHLWVYMSAPVAGAVCAVFLCGAIHGPGGCRPGGDAKA